MSGPVALPAAAASAVLGTQMTRELPTTGVLAIVPAIGIALLLFAGLIAASVILGGVGRWREARRGR